MNAGSSLPRCKLPPGLRRSAVAMLVSCACTAAPAVAQAEPQAEPQQADPQRGLQPGPRDARDRADALLDDDLPSEQQQPMWTGLRGYDQFEGAYTLPKPAHWSKLRNRLEVGSQGQLSESVKWKAGVRASYDAIYDLSNFYPDPVKQDQRFDFDVRETYFDVAAGNVEMRFGRQQIVWGEVVGLFFADVVSAKDLRETVLEDFDMLRIPQWAGRVEYFMGDTHLEAIWIPAPTVDRIGKPGSDFYAYPPAGPAGYGYVINDEKKPRRGGENMNYGLRVSSLVAGWDGAAFAYRSVDTQATFLRDVVPTSFGPAVAYTPVHDKVTQYGATLAKDFGDVVVKGEAVYARGRNFNVTRLSDADGVVTQDYLDYILSFEFGLPDENRLNFQFFQRRFHDHDPDIIPSARESGVSLFWSGKWGHFTPQVLAIHSLNRSDWMLRPKVVWNFDKNWRTAAGADIFGGRPNGLFGQYDQKDRVYVEVRRSF